jgi:hypothetical protein
MERWWDEGEHGFDDDTDRCVCGAEWMWWEPEKAYGCARSLPHWESGLVLDAWGRKMWDEVRE